MVLGELLERTVPALGYELVDWDMSARSRLVRVFIDKPGGVDVEDCASVSNHLTRLFAVENVDFERLEVSSPGLDRPVKRLADYARFAGQEAQLTLAAPVDGAKRIKGILRGTEGEDVLVETAGVDQRLEPPEEPRTDVSGQLLEPVPQHRRDLVVTVAVHRLGIDREPVGPVGGEHVEIVEVAVDHGGRGLVVGEQVTGMGSRLLHQPSGVRTSSWW